MTDIQRHLKGIRKILQNQLDAPEADWDVIRQEIRLHLPQSYGLGCGQLVDGTGNRSQPLQLLVYDRPLANDAYTDSSTTYRIDHTLLVIDAAVCHTEESLIAVLERIASVKTLVTRRAGSRPAPSRSVQRRPPGQQRETIPKHRLPFVLLMVKTLAESGNPFMHLDDLLSRYPFALRPDEIRVLDVQAWFRNPLLDDQPLTGHEIGLSYVDRLRKPELCYVCKEPFFRRHFHYEKLCLRCADLNYRKRHQNADLSGQIALVTGARVKIGYAAALKLLRARAEVIATSRFPRDAARRYAREPDFLEWKNRLHLYGLDLRDFRRLEQFIQHLYETYLGLDILINNAAQTVKRPPTYYAHLLPLETAPLLDVPADWQSLLEPPRYARQNPQRVLPSAYQLPAGSDTWWETTVFPTGQYDEHEQQIDNREFNSWVMRLEEVPMLEIVEVHLINAVAPALLAGQLKELMQGGQERNRYIINVAAAEGRFAQDKAGYHPHTNMAKAALNMLTRSIAEDYAAANIFVNSVDPGWVSDQYPHTSDESRAVAQEKLPLDLTDAAARICDPVFARLRISGRLLKDYTIVGW